MDLEKALDSPVLVLDTEGNSFDYRHDKRAKTMGVSVGFRASPTTPIQADYFPYFHEIGENLPESHLDTLREVIEKHPRIVCHNWPYDCLALENLGINVRDKPFYDTMLMTHFINENLISKALDYVSKHYGGKPKNKSELQTKFIKAVGWGSIPSWLMREYSANDSYITYELWEKLLPTFQEEGYDDELWEFEQEFARLKLKMESYGVKVDNDLCREELATGQARMHEISESMNGLNPNSPKDLEVLLIDCLGVKPYEKLTDTGKLCFDKEAMEYYEEELGYIDDPTAKLVLEYRGWLKACSAYYGAYIKLQSEYGILHPNFKLHGTRTGRLSCEKPNLQQIPRQTSKRWNGNAKRAIIARPGYTLWEIDYANLEFRLGAIYANEPNMIQPLQQGFKPFDAMAELLYGPDWVDSQRQDCKVFSYMTAYGAGITKIARTMRRSDGFAAKLRDDWFTAYPGMRRATRLATRKAEQRGYALLWTGRRRHFPDGSSTHKAFNAVIQGGAAELVKRTMLSLDKVIDWIDCKMLLQVHDSCVFEIRNGMEDYWLTIIQTIMENVSAHHPKFGLLPFPVDVKRWGTDTKWTMPNRENVTMTTSASPTL